MATKIDVRNLNVWFEDNHAIKDVNLEIEENMITAIIGPSGCGKSTFVRSINRMNDIIPVCRTTGEIIIDGKNVYDKGMDVVEVRRRIGA